MFVFLHVRAMLVQFVANSIEENRTQVGGRVTWNSPVSHTEWQAMACDEPVELNVELAATLVRLDRMLHYIITTSQNVRVCNPLLCPLVTALFRRRKQKKPRLRV